MIAAAKKGDKKMNTEWMNQENEITLEIEELEEKITPQSSATFLD
jgi:hypothetical protein